MAKKKKKWLQKAVPESHKGRFTNWCKRHGFKGPNKSCIKEAEKDKYSTHVHRMAAFAKRAKGGF